MLSDFIAHRIAAIFHFYCDHHTDQHFFHYAFSFISPFLSVCNRSVAHTFFSSSIFVQIYVSHIYSRLLYICRVQACWLECKFHNEYPALSTGFPGNCSFFQLHRYYFAYMTLVFNPTPFLSHRLNIQNGRYTISANCQIKS